MLELMGIAVVGLLAGALVTRRTFQRRLKAATGGLLVPPTLSPEEYQKDRTFYIDMYKTSMQQFDKIVPTVAGGALVVSVPLLREIDKLGGFRIALGIGWLLFLIAVSSAVTGHYMSSRIYSSERAALDLANHPRPTPTMMQEAATLHAQAKQSGVATLWLNRLSLVSVVSGLILLGVFAVSLVF